MEKVNVAHHYDNSFVVALLLKIENKNTCPRCGCEGKAVADNGCAMCKVIAIERNRFANMPESYFE